MTTQKYIYWRTNEETKGKCAYAHVHILVGYNQGTLADFQKMAAELRETFPDAGNDQINLGTIVKSDIVKGYSLITWSGHIPRGEYPGWEQIEDKHIPYCW